MQQAPLGKLCIFSDPSILITTELIRIVRSPLVGRQDHDAELKPLDAMHCC
ncbi:hypothetical protein FQZ97_635140 [compost metagenome]